MRGPKTSVTLKKLVNTPSGGNATESWIDVVTFKAVFIAKRLSSERVLADRVTTYATHRLYADASAIGVANLDEITEANHIKVGSKEYTIEGIADYTNEHGFYEIDLLLRED